MGSGCHGPCDDPIDGHVSVRPAGQAHPVTDPEFVGASLLRNRDGEAGIQVDDDFDPGPAAGGCRVAKRAAGCRTGMRRRSIYYPGKIDCPDITRVISRSLKYWMDRS